MFILNFKVNGNKFAKIFLGILLLIIIVTTIFISIKLLTANNFKSNDTYKNNVNEISPKNYTNILKSVHENLNTYIGQSIKFSGYIYKLFDFTESQFVLARDMIISSNFQTVVVGFLCENKNNMNEFIDNDWVEIEGTINKGYYHGEIPIIEIKKMRKIEKPSEEYVYPPDDSYVQTSTILE